MRISDLIKMGLRNLSRRKARTALTVIGVIIGTISIVVMISIGIGMNTNFKSQVMEQGSLTTITVEKYASIIDEDGNWLDSKEQIMDDTLVEQLRGIEHVKAVSPLLYKNGLLRSGKYEAWVQVYAMDSSTFQDFDFPGLSAGSYPTKEMNKSLLFGSDTLLNFYNPSSRNHSTKTIDLEKDKVTFQFEPYQYQQNERKKPFSLKV